MQKYVLFPTNTNLKRHKSCLKRYNYKNISYFCTQIVNRKL